MTPTSPTPQPTETRTFSIDRSVSGDDMTLIISHGEHLPEQHLTRLHTHLVNMSDQDRSATLSVGDSLSTTMPAGPTAGPTIVPAKSTRHQVVDVHREDDKPVNLEMLGPDHETLTMEIL